MDYTSYNESQKVKPIYRGVTFSSGYVCANLSALKQTFRSPILQRSKGASTGTWKIPGVYLW